VTSSLFFILLICLILGLIALAGGVLLISASRRGEGVANARRGWIEGGDEPDEG